LDWKLEEQRQDRLVEFAAKNRMKMRVIGLVGLLLLGTSALISLPRLVDRSIHTPSDRARLDIGLLEKGLEEFKTDSGRYPGALNELLDAGKEYVVGSRIRQDPWGETYVYKCPGEHDPEGYDLLSCGADGLAGTEDDITGWSTDNR